MTEQVETTEQKLSRLKTEAIPMFEENGTDDDAIQIVVEHYKSTLEFNNIRDQDKRAAMSIVITRGVVDALKEFQKPKIEAIVGGTQIQE